MRIAIIDIGSNSVKLAIYEDNNLIIKRSKTTRLVFDAQNNILKTASINNTIEAIFAFINEAKNLACDKVLAYGTEALRAAKNSSELTNKVFEHKGVEIDIITSELESKIGFVGATNNVSCENLAFIDIGGASLELATGNSENILLSKSFPIGAVTLKQSCNDNREKIEQAFNDNISEEFLSEFSSVVDKLIKNKNHTLYSCCGSAKAIAASIDAGTDYNYPKIITLENLVRFNDIIENMPVKMRELTLNIDKERADIIFGASVIFEKVLMRLNIKSITVTNGNASYGYLMHFMNK